MTYQPHQSEDTTLKTAAEMSLESRAMLLNVLWHHQGGSSPVGQPLRKLLGIGQFDHLTDEQLAEAKWIDGLCARGVSVGVANSPNLEGSSPNSGVMVDAAPKRRAATDEEVLAWAKRHVNSHNALATLKRELQDYNIQTAKWKEPGRS